MHPICSVLPTLAAQLYFSDSPTTREIEVTLKRVWEGKAHGSTALVTNACHFHQGKKGRLFSLRPEIVLPIVMMCTYACKHNHFIGSWFIGFKPNVTQEEINFLTIVRTPPTDH